MSFRKDQHEHYTGHFRMAVQCFLNHNLLPIIGQEVQNWKLDHGSHPLSSTISMQQ